MCIELLKSAWFAIGFILYAMVVGLYGSLAFLRYRKEGNAVAHSLDAGNSGS
jgi:ABC-type spermidine/putrescine transport system permease subunit II